MQRVGTYGKQLSIAMSLHVDPSNGVKGEKAGLSSQRRAAQSSWCMGWMWRASSWA